ncbi:phosphoribosylamine--glycine ligase [Deinococcus peraridilitoris]|uniref:Phosphoribosylamine--glycine ligase n=1 Tax=Deinococcus peraridilitoris (strain DSM 19664 / LMG 22246 / CIP 109416 / KR-200) TaxID=937777 RepID=L0A6L6_DEIPD|nr:phosphoribosylamine--glycine ligase [Deinococcus peraridilitoris]AFZ68827.1 phosphoribosylamine--glycine ligase [Deinococcus peraridilitoris DSM 19664]
MKVLLIGSGGREHALAEALSRSPSLSALLATPGNPGIAQFARIVEAVQSPSALADLAQREQVDLTVVGPEVPLVAGVVDEFEARGLRIFGPTRKAARIEGDKAWSKAFMSRHGIPTARHESLTDLTAARDAAERFPLPLVVKDAGLRAGKGVTICHARDEVETALLDIFSQPDACAVLEEFMVGQEVTVLAFTDGTRAVAMPTAQDHKTIFENDTGPMTGGMGVICPFPLTHEQHARIEREILGPTLAGLRREGAPFVGVLYAGLMLTAEGPKVVEFNCRFGDPEAEAVLPLLRSDLLKIIEACLNGRLTPELVQFDDGASAVVVMAAPGYPGEAHKGAVVELPALQASERIFHAGTALQNGQLVAAGGRVLAVQARGDDLDEAVERAYAVVERVRFPGAQLRRDIGFRVGVAVRAKTR